MEENQIPVPENAEETPVCAGCGNPEILHGHSTKFCANCRNAYIKYPIPLWVKLFGVGIMVLMAVSFALSPKNFEAAIALSRAEKFENRQDYASEQRELRKAVEIAPNSVEILAHLLIASFYNADFVTYDEAIRKLGGKNFNDSELLKKVNDITAYTVDYFPSDSLVKMYERYPKGIPDSTYARYTKLHPTDVYTQYAFASACFDKENYSKTDSLLAGVTTINPHHMYALFLRSITKREMNQLDSSVYFCDKLLQENHQSAMGLSSKARTLLKQGHFKDGLDMALKTNELDSAFYYNKATLAIAYHFNKKTKERDALIKQSSNDSTLAASMQYASEIISGKRDYGVQPQK